MKSSILLPTVALAGWSMVMWVWMYATRIPYIVKTRIKLDPQAPRGEQMSTLPSEIRWKADNYNHLMEQPTSFYAVALALAVMGEGEGLNATLAWIYLGIRIVHSFVQAVTNNINQRFVLFSLSSLVLCWLVVNALMALL